MKSLIWLGSFLPPQLIPFIDSKIFWSMKEEQGHELEAKPFIASINLLHKERLIGWNDGLAALPLGFPFRSFIPLPFINWFRQTSCLHQLTHLHSIHLLHSLFNWLAFLASFSSLSGAVRLVPPITHQRKEKPKQAGRVTNHSLTNQINFINLIVHSWLIPLGLHPPSTLPFLHSFLPIRKRRKEKKRELNGVELPSA